MHASRLRQFPQFRPQPAGIDCQRLLSARVEAVADGQVYLDYQGQRLSASRAVSCLVSPMKGDRVAFMLEEGGQIYVLSILQRETAGVCLESPGDLSIRAGSGRLDLHGGRGMGLSTAADCAVTAASLNLQAGRLQAQGEECNAVYGRVSLVANTLMTMAGTLMQKARNSVRQIEQLDKVNAGEMITHVRKLFSLRASQSMVTAKKDVKIDAERVHIG